MSYLDKFKERDGKGLVYSASLSYEFVEQMVKEFLGLHEKEIDPEYLDEKVIADWLDKMDDTVPARLFREYFKPSLVNVANVPTSGGLLVANHTGMFGWDGLAVYYSVYKSTGRALTMIGHNVFENSDLRKTFGVITGHADTAVSLLKEDRLALVCPGGARETTKPIWKRYKVQRVGGFARGNYGYLLVALESKKPIVPVGVVGAEETHIQFGNVKPLLDGVVDKAYSKLPNLVKDKAKPYKHLWDIAQSCPLMLNVIPFPSKITVYVGEPINFYEVRKDVDPARVRSLRQKEDLSPAEEREKQNLEGILYDMNERVLDSVQYLIDVGRKLRE
ncbi:MAG: hypothetical protein V1729_06935 [Candidatus Woesearchaeota archaeon]